MFDDICVHGSPWNTNTYCTMLLIMSPYYFYLVGSHTWIFEEQSIHFPFAHYRKVTFIILAFYGYCYLQIDGETCRIIMITGLYLEHTASQQRLCSLGEKEIYYMQTM